nr:MAG TPA: hypothetical protein [Caudoviricetes sp.]
MLLSKISFICPLIISISSFLFIDCLLLMY